MSGDSRRPLVPGFLLGRFADASGRLMAERRDRGRRLALSAEAAAAQTGVYGAVEPPSLGGLLERIETRAAASLDRLVGAGPFPPAEEERALLALFFAVQLVLSRRYRAGVAQSTGFLSELIGAALRELEDAEPESEEATEAAGPGDAAAAGAEIVVHGDPPEPLSLAPVPRLARGLHRRVWQLVRFPDRVLLTGDAPVVLWSRPGSAKPYQFGVGTADEVRVPLDPRHALILARRAAAGEVVRELDERHARALNRIVAEAAHTWMYYHPDSDPLVGVELASP